MAMALHERRILLTEDHLDICNRRRFINSVSEHYRWKSHECGGLNGSSCERGIKNIPAAWPA